MSFIKKLLGIKSETEKKQLLEELDEVKLNLKNKVSALTQPAVHLIYTESRTNSMFGGKPIVDNENFAWPFSNGRPMSFLVQFDLREIAQQLKYDWLSDSGYLLFFYDIEKMPWGFDPKDKGKWKVIYQSAPSIEIDYPEGLKAEFIIKEKHIKARKIDILPSFEDRSIQNLNLNDEETDLYIEIDEHYREFDSYGEFPAHQVGGFPRPVQGDEMQFEAQLASGGTYMGDSKAYQGADARDFESAKAKWKLLFQFDSDEDLGAIWRDLGTLYFWVDKEESKINKFENTWLILQCT